MGHNKVKTRGRRLVLATSIFMQDREAMLFMARGNTQRWLWLMETFRGLSPQVQAHVTTWFNQRYDPGTGTPRDDQVMYEIMTELGLVFKGVDPCPPPIKYVTDAGAAEYEEVMVIQELGEDL